MNLYKTLSIIFLTIFIANSAKSEILLEDNFNSAVSGDINTGLFNRQSGSAATVNYQWWTGGTTPIVTNAGPYADKGYWGKNTQVSLVHNFTESQNFNIEFDLIWTETNSGAACSVLFGRLNEWLMGPWHQSGATLRFHSSGSYNLWTNGVEIAHWPYCAELAATSNQVNRIKLCVSQNGFPASDGKARLALFINEKPYPLDKSAAPKFICEIESGFTNNYIGLDAFSGFDIALDNLKISTAENSVSTTNWNNDADSEISNSKIYSHAVNLAGDDVTINSVPFTGSPSNLMSGANWEIKTESGGGYAAYNTPSFGYAPNISGDSYVLSTNILFDAVNSGCLTLSGLTAGNNYALTIYSVGMDYGLGGPGTAPHRNNYYATSDGGIISLFDQNEFVNNNGQILTYNYTAPESGIFSISAAPTNNPLAWYAFSNVAMMPDPPDSISASQGIYTDKIRVSWSEIATADSYTLLKAETNNFPSATVLQSGIISNLFDDSVTDKKDYYYWISSTNSGGESTATGPAIGFAKSANPPVKPINTSPESFNIVTSPVNFVANNYSDTGMHPFAASQWQSATDSGFSSINWNSGEFAPPITSIFAPQNSIPAGTNFWRVRYKNDRNSWSDWSDATSFICVSGEEKAGVFLDTFNVSGNGDVNYGYDNSGRQFGNVSPLTYKTEGTTKTENYKLTLEQNSGCSPNHNFTENSNFRIEFDAEPHNFDGSTDWISCAFGKTDQSSFSPSSASGLGVTFSANGTFNLYEKTTLKSSSAGVPTAKKFHVTISASTKAFDDGDPVFCSVFVDGVPMVIDTTFKKYFYETDYFENNYVTLFNYNNVGIQSSFIDNFSIQKAGPAPTVSKWTSDADSLISDDVLREYTHLVNLNGENVIINTREFIGTGALTNDSFFNNGDPIINTNGWQIISAEGWTSFRTAEQTPSNQITGLSYELSKYFVFSGGGFSLKLSELLPYSSNSLYLFSKAIGAPDWGYDATFSSSHGNVFTNINVDGYGMDWGSIVKFDYIASADGTFTAAATPDDPNVRYHISGFANEQTGVPESGSIFLIFNLLFFILSKKNHKRLSISGSK